ncbi:MAG: Ig-like domain-containing protein, partial [Bacteroidales bacterium]|nr:Ig-like domain-containing protein [Bacteroidales bacterium]
MKEHFSPIPMILTVLAALMALMSCANPGGAPGGGPRDVTPPVLLVAEPPQGTVDFQAKTVTMEFDEFIELREQDKIYTSPVLNQVTYSSNLKKLKVEIDDTLRPDYTYTIRFGNSVVDMHEANPIPDFHYVFSTGATIDSMYMNGRVIKAVDYKPEKNVRLLFYLHRPDSFPFQDDPDYVAIADNDGWFEAIHIKDGCYYVYGVMDENQDYRIDPVTEMMAYTDSCVPSRKMIPEAVLSAADSLALIDSLMQAADSLMDVADSLAWVAAYAAYDADTVGADTVAAAYTAYAESVADSDTAETIAADTLADVMAAEEVEAEAGAFIHLYLYRDYLPAFFLKEVTYKQRNQMAFTFYYPVDSIEDIRFIEVTDTSETELAMPLFWQWAADRRSAVVHFPNHALKDCDLIMTVSGYSDTTSVYMADAIRSKTDTAALQLKAPAAKLLLADTLKFQASFPIDHIDKERMAVWRFVPTERAVRDTVWLRPDTLSLAEADTAAFTLVDTVRVFTDTLVQPFELSSVDAWTWAVQTEREEGGRYAFFMQD